jgi:alpha-galactosidase
MLRNFNGKRRKIAFIGASFKFVHQGVRDFIIAPKLAGATHLENTDVYLYDIDPAPMNLEYDVITRMIREQGSSLRVFKTASRQEALEGADYVVVSVLVGGMDAAEQEDLICQEYGIRHTVGDTIGPMCVSRCLRMVPLMLDIACDMQKYCPNAPMLSVTNPMAVLTHAINKYTKTQCVGICHGTEGQVKQIATVYGVKRNEVCVDVVGVNHFGLITRVEVQGRTVPMDELIGKIREALKKGYVDPATGGVDESEQAFEFFRMTKLLPNNGDHHFIEFLPFFLAKHAFKDGKNVYGMDKRLHSAPDRRKRHLWFRDTVAGWAYAPADKPIPDMTQFSSENIIDIVSGFENKGFVNSSELHLNMTNGGAVPNLPADCNLELTCHLTPRGMQPVQMEPLPPYALGITLPKVCQNQLALKASIDKDKQAFLEALLLDPLLQEFNTVEQLADRLWKVNEKYWTPVK